MQVKGIGIKTTRELLNGNFSNNYTMCLYGLPNRQKCSHLPSCPVFLIQNYWHAQPTAGINFRRV